MGELNTNIPVFECLVRAEYLYDGDRKGTYEHAAVFGAASVPGRALGFHCLMGNGAVYGRLPVSALAHKESDPPASVGECQLWDCPSEHVSCIEYDLLKESRCHVLLPSGEQKGTYMFTLDWWGSSYAESAGALGWKSAHVIRLDNGWFVAQPNNRILWSCPAFVKRTQKPEYKLTTKTYKCEALGTTGDNYFYEVKKPQVSINSNYEIGSGVRDPCEQDKEEWKPCVPGTYVPRHLVSAYGTLKPVKFIPSEHTNHIIGDRVECRYCHNNPCTCTTYQCYPPIVGQVGPRFAIIGGYPTCDNCRGRSHGCYCTQGKTTNTISGEIR